jgi:hypothetical protein
VEGAQKHAIPSRSTQKYFTPTLGVNTKKIPNRISPNKCFKFLLLSLKSFIAEKKHVAMQNLFIKKEKKESTKKMVKCLRYLKQWVLQCPPKKRDE